MVAGNLLKLKMLVKVLGDIIEADMDIIITVPIILIPIIPIPIGIMPFMLQFVGNSISIDAPLGIDVENGMFVGLVRRQES